MHCPPRYTGTLAALSRRPLLHQHHEDKVDFVRHAVATVNTTTTSTSTSSSSSSTSSSSSSSSSSSLLYDPHPYLQILSHMSSVVGLMSTLGIELQFNSMVTHTHTHITCHVTCHVTTFQLTREQEDSNIDDRTGAAGLCKLPSI